MLKEMDFLPANIFGKLLGYKGVRLDCTTLEIHKRSTQSQLDLTECSVFAQLNEKWYGSQLTVILNKKSKSIRFLKKQGAKDFVQTLNEQIAISVTSYVSSMINAWDDAVVTQYPRQSRLEELRQICSLISKGYKNHPATWSKYLIAQR
jgi:DNA helicase-4